MFNIVLWFHVLTTLYINIMDVFLRHPASFRGDVVFFTMHTVHGSTCNCSLAAWMLQLIQWAAGVICLNMCINMYQYVYVYIYIYSVYIHIYIYASPPLRSTFDAFPETCMMKLTAYFNELCSEFDHENCVRSSKKQYPYNLQHVEHSSKHAVFFSEEVQFSSRKLFSLRSIIQYFFQNTRFLICSVWLTLSIAVKMCNGWCSLQHSLKRKIVVKGKCCVQVTICHEYKIVPWTAPF